MWKKEETVIHSFEDDLGLSVIMYIPEEPKAIVQICHGMCEYKERYTRFMEELADDGYVVIIHDLRGHGKSVRSINDLGYFYDTENKNYIVEDVQQLTRYIKERFPELPYILFGHSMGSLVARTYTKYYDYELDGLIVCGAPKNQAGVGFMNSMLGLRAKFGKEHNRPNFLQNAAFKSFNKKFDGLNKWLSTDQSVVDAYNKDPYCSFVFTENGFRNLFHLVDETYDKHNWKVSKPDLKILFIAGAEDPCIGGRANFEKTLAAMAKVGYKNIDSKLYEGYRHEILNDYSHDEVVVDVKAFLSKAKEDFVVDPLKFL